jgi:pSer/pThr/pTyr-binding forkhead associated (FHA) protein
MTAAPPRVVVVGQGGVLDGERRALVPGATLVVGRSRSCHLSLRKCRRFLASDEQPELLASEGFRRVSRVHCEIAYLPDGRVEIRDLSRNGTLVDGRRLARPCVLVPGDDVVEVVLADPVHGSLHVSFESPAG